MFENINFELRRGEILGFYGLVGAGRTELARVIVGADRCDGGNVYVNGKLARVHTMQDALTKYNMGYVSENRKEEGLILPFPVLENMTIPSLPQYRRPSRLLDLVRMKKTASDYIDNMQVKTPGMATVVEELSGGNQQKVSIGKWLAAGCDILIIDEPTVGVDVGAKRNIHKVIHDLAAIHGKSIILISSDMPEIISLASRLLLMKDYKISGEMDMTRRQTSYEDLTYEIGNMIM
jgi:ribose transport system ATP-binding protein